MLHGGDDRARLTGAFCVAGPRGIDPLYERRNTYDFWRGLAIRLGQSTDWPWKTVDDVWDYRLSPVGLTFDGLLERNGLFGKPEFERYKKYGFGTPSGKVELRSSTFEALGCHPARVPIDGAQPVRRCEAGRGISSRSHDGQPVYADVPLGAKAD